MIIHNCSAADVDAALNKANKQFHGNLTFKRFDSNPKDTRHTVTITVHDSRLAGGRRGMSGRRVAAACWHAHGVFIDALPEQATIYTSVNGTTRPGSPWVDRNIGSMMYPLYYSEACDCGN